MANKQSQRETMFAELSSSAIKSDLHGHEISCDRPRMRRIGSVHSRAALTRWLASEKLRSWLEEGRKNVIKNVSLSLSLSLSSWTTNFHSILKYSIRTHSHYEVTKYTMLLKGLFFFFKLENKIDNSVSRNFFQFMTKWVIFHFFDRVRENLKRWYQIEENKILNIGSGKSSSLSVFDFIVSRI